MTLEEIQAIRQVIRQELAKNEGGVDLEFADLIRMESGDSGFPEPCDIAFPREQFAQSDHDSFYKLFEAPAHAKVSLGSEKFAATLELRKKLCAVGIATGRLKPEDDLALFLAGTESQARAALRRMLGGAAA